MPTIVTDSHDHIVIEDKPWILGLSLIFFGLAAIATGLQGIAERDLFQVVIGLLFSVGVWFCFKLGVRRTRLTLLPDGTAALTIRDATGLKERSFPSGTLRAGLATQTNDGETYRAILLVETPDGLERVPLTRYLSSSRSHETVVERINAWARTVGVNG